MEPLSVLAGARDDLALFIDDVGGEPAQHLFAARGGGAQFIEHRIVEFEHGMHGAATRLHEFDLARLVPDEIVRAQAAQHRDHPERIGHREQAAAEMGLHVVAVPRTHPQFDPDAFPVRTDLGDVDAGEQERRPQVEAAAQGAGFHRDVQNAGRGTMPYGCVLNKRRLP